MNNPLKKMDENSYLTDQEPLYNEEDLSTFTAPIEYKLHWLLRYTYKLQRSYDLCTDELAGMYEIYEDFKNKSFRNQELQNQNAELRRTIKQMSTQISELTLKVLSNSKRK